MTNLKADNRTKTMQFLVDHAAKKGEKAFKDQYEAYLKEQLRITGHRLVIKADKDGKLVRTVKRLIRCATVDMNLAGCAA